jgi:putative PIN family toxin of toxin-antitoxin system
MKRIVLDTNCLLAILPSKSIYHRIWTGFINEQLEFAVSNDILLEYEEILATKASPYIAEVVIKTLLNKPNLIRVNPVWKFDLIQSDPDDNKFVDCAIVANAQFLVSEDKHFNVLKSIDFPKVLVIGIKDFVKSL